MKAIAALFILFAGCLADQVDLSNVHHLENGPELPVNMCGKKFGCFALPNNTCLQSANGADCSSLAMYQRNPASNHSYSFRIYTREPQNHMDGYWIALGLSNADNKMPNTSIVECRVDYNTWPSSFLMQTGFALNYTRPVLRAMPAVHPKAAFWGTGGMGCWFNIDKHLVAGDHEDDLSKPTFLLLAHGQIRNNLLLFHDGKAPTKKALNLGKYPTTE